MQPDYLSTIFFLIFIFNTQKSSCADDYRFTNCSLPVYCGNQSIDIYYPFWGVNRADYCGLLGFQMECQDGILKIKMLSNMFRILGINQTTQTLKVARDDFWYSICPTNLFNTTIDFTRFSYAPGQRNLTLYYGCPIRPDPFIVSSDCAVNGTSMNVLYVPQSSPVDPLIGSCYCSVIVPVLETTAQELDQGRNFVNDTLDEGFEVQWILGNDQCNTCVNSGGFADTTLPRVNSFAFAVISPMQLNVYLVQDLQVCLLYQLNSFAPVLILSAPFRCANLENLEYPFWGAGRPEFCGHPTYELNCLGEVAEITIMAKNYGVIYRVLEVNNVSWTVTIAIEDYWDNNCSGSPVTGTIDPWFFNYTSNTENVTLYYGCPPLGNDISVLLPLKFNSSPEETDTNNYYFIWGDDAANQGSTETHSVVRSQVSETARNRYETFRARFGYFAKIRNAFLDISPSIGNVPKQYVSSSFPVSFNFQ
ncbi:LEAF RUST 10 DISEASE-RESISTANCE LOCUS RECEPTOR-LIKE PROTEIN KINASE-like 2.8 [Mangifera indica]|uniref:LEAF RUST 10 DISEASE-RESISTANCE LOCUS RECEPTOR-LIKE PROTEIN KINASE-like 2.8 n=1 Tax=Mangifera indica TaxID=29780 RepID=UPI001CFBD456|nr:LEAF RUST 10 DISEASE-RESISTANCE LOCUS RECEPTOR-LIKE PROTEIN KINASE-like 2.8 [Mangifera indica]